MYTSVVPAVLHRSGTGIRACVAPCMVALAGSVLMAAQTAPANDYADARICASCHGAIAESYRQTGMGRSLFRPTAANTMEDYTNSHEFYHPLSDTHYAMIRRDGASFQRRWQIGFGGREENVEESKIDYVIGSGNHSRSYLHRTARGTLIELPLSWYSEKGGGWGMSPAFDSRHPLTRRLASYECIFCHDAYPRIPPGHDAPDSEPVFTGDLPEGIDCQRCHGPGANHVRTVQTAGAKPDEIRASIVNPARLSPKLRMEICMQCHLEPTSTAIPSLIRRFNRGPFSFRAGEPLEDFLLAFDHAPGKGRDDKFEIVNSSAYRLRRSRCFLESKAALTCETCHDPHHVSRGEEALRHYSSVCRQCHATALDSLISRGAHPAAADCTSCHMPKRRTEDVVHVVMTDHLIQRRPPPGDLLAGLPERHPSESEEYRGEVVPYYPAALPNVMYGFAAQIAMRNNLQKGLAELDRELKVQQPRVAEWYMVLGDGWQASGKPAEAAAAYERAVRLRPDSLRGLLSLAAALRSSGQPFRSSEVLGRAIQFAPSDARAWYQSGVLAAELGRTSEAIERVQKGIGLDPDLPGESTSLAGILARAGQNDRAETALREALRIDPYDSAAWDLGGRALTGRGQLPEALYDFERAIRYRPDFAPHLYDYALALTSASRFEQARESVEAALRADPKMAEAHELLGGLLARERRLPEATREYREAVRLRPDFARAQLDLASALATQGDMPGAVQHLREAAKGGDPDVARLAAQQLERLGQR
jgi:tetratricopeptide (TPR) repeat protein